MGMDIHGVKPTSEAGKYFRRNIWGWRPLAQCVTILCPKETALCKHWQSNDGDGLDGPGARDLAVALQDRIDVGDIRTYVKIRDDMLASLPNETCEWCGGTGTRRDSIGVASGQPECKIPADAKWMGGAHPRAGQIGSCNACDGRGFNRPNLAAYPLEENDVTEFIEFLRDCGGFEID